MTVRSSNSRCDRGDVSLIDSWDADRFLLIKNEYYGAQPTVSLNGKRDTMWKAIVLGRSKTVVI
jgi:hypothetical protein